MRQQQKDFMISMDSELQRRTASACELVADVASNFGKVCLRVTGASMIPAVWPGDVIHVRRSNPAELRPGQIALHRRYGSLVVHRIVRIEGNRIITRGDTLLEDDPAIPAVDVLGRVDSMVRSGRLLYHGQSFWQRAVSAILRRSDFCLRMLLRLRRLRRGSKGTDLSWSS